MKSKEALENLTYCVNGMERKEKYYKIIKQDLDKLEKLEKVIEILKNNYFTVTSNANSETGYIMCVESGIIQQEYNLLKEVLGMKKIIKQKPKTYKMECPRCDCEFEYELEDITTGYDLEMYVQCPECGKSIRHDYRLKEKVLKDD